MGILFILLLNPFYAHGVCSPVGKQRYQANTMEFCDGASWKSMKGASVTGCTAGESGKVRWSSSRYEFCNGTNWYHMKGSSLGACTAGENKKQRYASGTMQFCDGANWYSMNNSNCGGTVIGIYCWYYGTAGQSCDTVCATHGLCNEAITKAGAGSDANCNAILDALGAPSGGMILSALDPCFFAPGTPTRGRGGSVSPACPTATAGSRPACACNN